VCIGIADPCGPCLGLCCEGVCCSPGLGCCSGVCNNTC
jgi:hypothetical protein